ncbi:hypothetical protein AAFF_G00283800 [Aldrovandia affinis]|uniref:Uncharacterized protein n=1 Tax=Aldrovandia affinis TaxID=143900 RepID=A0AAD7TBA2_9TELE|nr:hypothetical protein AAFF_G00283800 [Aldrovandia affinis]
MQKKDDFSPFQPALGGGKMGAPRLITLSVALGRSPRPVSQRERGESEVRRVGHITPPTPCFCQASLGTINLPVCRPRECPLLFTFAADRCWLGSTNLNVI